MPNNFTELDKLATIIALSAGMWGAILSFFRRDTKGFSIKRKILMFIMDMFINVGLTMLTYLGLVGYGINDLLAVAISGFFGHQGVRSFYLMELIITEKLGAKATFTEIAEGKKNAKK